MRQLSPRVQFMALPLALLGVAIAPVGLLVVLVAARDLPAGQLASALLIVSTMLLSTVIFMGARRLRASASWNRAENVGIAIWVALAVLAIVLAGTRTFVPLIVIVVAEIVGASVVAIVRGHRLSRAESG